MIFLGPGRLMVTFWDQLIQLVVSGLSTGSIYALVALGFCIIHNATGIVNFTQVDFITLGGMVMYTFSGTWDGRVAGLSGGRGICWGSWGVDLEACPEAE